jgi:hypothetical protein
MRRPDAARRRNGHLRVLLDRIADHHINRVGDLAPWNLKPDIA